MVAAALQKFISGESPMQTPLPFPDPVPALTVVKSPRVKAATPAAFYWGADGIQPVALKYRDGEFHSSFGARAAPGYSARDFSANEDGYARAYLTCVWAYRAINVFVQKVAEVLRRGQVVDKQTAREIPDHALMQAFDLAFRFYQQDIFEYWLLSKQIYGEAYVELVNAFPFNAQSIGVPRALRVLNALGVEPVIQRGAIVQYRYNGDDEATTFTPYEIAFDRYTNPLDDVRGYSPLAAALDSVNVDRTIVLFTRSHLKNNARPGLIFTPKEGRLSQADVDMIQSTLSEDVKGAANAGNPLLMPTAFDVTVAQPPAMDDLNALTDEHKRRICSAIGVPIALVDYTDMAFQLSPEQNKTFYELTVIPAAEKVVRVINTQVLPFFDSSRKTEFKINVDGIRAGLADPKTRTEIANLRLQAGGITLNEYREQLDMAAVTDGDVRYVPMGVQIVKAGMLGQTPAPLPQTPPAPLLGAGNGSVADAQPPAVNAVPMKAEASAEIVKELKDWRLVVGRKGIEFPFVPLHLPAVVSAYVRLALDDGEDVTDVFKAARELADGIAAKAFINTRAAFIRDIKQIIGDAQASAVSRAKFGGAMRSIIRKAGLIALRDGMNEVQYDPESLSVEELSAFRSWQEEASLRVTNLGAEIFKQGISEAEVAIRAEMWANITLESARQLGILLGKPNQLMEWQRGPTSDSCEDCIRLEFQVHTMKEWVDSGWTPTSRKTACGSYNCLCSLVPTDKPKRGEF